VLSPGTVAAVHPVGFLVITRHHVYGVPVSEELIISRMTDSQYRQYLRETYGF
jgi:hypothetical protein